MELRAWKAALARCGYTVLPGFADVHVHLREPGFSYKETILTGTRAAARGGYTAVCAMPNLDPAPDSPQGLAPQLALIQRDACVTVKPYGCITLGQKGRTLADLEGLAPLVCGYSDDGHGVADGGLMREAMVRAKALGKPIAAHCEDTAYPPEDPASEWREAERNIALALDTGCALHICHVSSRVTLELVRQGKRAGADLSCETAPHYLLLDETLRQDSGDWKMNPPLRAPADREALAEGLADGTVDMVATDHAPHAPVEKAGGFAASLNGVTGLECAFPVLYTGLVLPGHLRLEQLLHALSAAPRARFRLPVGRDCTVFALGEAEAVKPEGFLSMGKSTPFAGMPVHGRCLLTLAGGSPVWQDPAWGALCAKMGVPETPEGGSQ